MRVDGLEDSDGIFMIGSTTNCRFPHVIDAWWVGRELMILMDKLDPGLSRRLSRFDRKYRFGNPLKEDRVRYCEDWK